MPFNLGRNRRGKDVALSNEHRSRHMHVIGGSGTGKSKFLESLLRQDVLSGRGFCLIDPHGTLADNIVEWCASRRADQYRRIHIITPSDLDWAAGFNPLRIDNMVETQARVDAMVNACAQVWGGEDLATTPLLKRCLKAIFHVLAVRELTLLEAVELVTARHGQGVRRALTQDLPDSVYNAQWSDFNALNARDFLEQFSSTNNRLMQFLGSPVMRRVVGQRNNVLDLGRAMDESEIVIVNLKEGGAISPEDGKLLGTLLTSELFLLAKSRTEEMANHHPFTLYVDECYDFLTPDIGRMLDQTRKFGLHVVLAHQRLGQLRDASPSIYNGVVAGAQTKVVFGGMEDEDAELMARQVFRSSFNLERPKHSLDKLTVVGEVPFWLDSESYSEGDAWGEAAGTQGSSSSTSGMSAGDTDSFREDELRAYGRSQSRGTLDTMTDGSGWSWSENSQHSSSSTHGRSQTLKPVRVLLPTAVHSLDEEIHLAIVKLRELPPQAAILKRPAMPPVRIRPATVTAPLVREATVEKFVERTRAASPYISATAVVDAEIRDRQALLSGRPKAAVEAADSFWVEEST